jgi:spermidine synthase
VLRRIGEHLEVISNGVFLMDTRDGRSERLLVRGALDRHRGPRRLLIGGLGVGYSLLEAVADPLLTHIDVVEIEPALVDWHAGPLRAVSGGALDDPRVTVHVEDFREHLVRPGPAYDVICLDVDNGPDWTVSESNAGLYDDAGTALLLERLTPGGFLAVWSAHPVAAYEERLRRLASDVEVLTVEVARGAPDVVYLASARRHRERRARVAR